MTVTAQWLFYNYTMIENYIFLRNESQSLKFLYFRQVVVSAKCPFVKLSVRQNVRLTKCMSVGKLSVRQNVFRQSVFRQNVRVPLQLARFWLCICLSLCNLFNKSLFLGKLPCGWKLSNIILIAVKSLAQA